MKSIEKTAIDSINDFMVQKLVSEANDMVNIEFNLTELEKYISFQTNLEMRTPVKKTLHR